MSQQTIFVNASLTVDIATMSEFRDFKITNYGPASVTLTVNKSNFPLEVGGTFFCSVTTLQATSDSDADGAALSVEYLS